MSIASALDQAVIPIILSLEASNPQASPPVFVEIPFDQATITEGSNHLIARLDVEVINEHGGVQGYFSDEFNAANPIQMLSPIRATIGVIDEVGAAWPVAEFRGFIRRITPAGTRLKLLCHDQACLLDDGIAEGDFKATSVYETMLSPGIDLDLAPRMPSYAGTVQAVGANFIDVLGENWPNNKWVDAAPPYTIRVIDSAPPDLEYVITGVALGNRVIVTGNPAADGVLPNDNLIIVRDHDRAYQVTGKYNPSLGYGCRTITTGMAQPGVTIINVASSVGFEIGDEVSIRKPGPPVDTEGRRIVSIPGPVQIEVDAMININVGATPIYGKRRAFADVPLPLIIDAGGGVQKYIHQSLYEIYYEVGLIAFEQIPIWAGVPYLRAVAYLQEGTNQLEDILTGIATYGGDGGAGFVVLDCNFSPSYLTVSRYVCKEYEGSALEYIQELIREIAPPNYVFRYDPLTDKLITKFAEQKAIPDYVLKNVDIASWDRDVDEIAGRVLAISERDRPVNLLGVSSATFIGSGNPADYDTLDDYGTVVGAAVDGDNSTYFRRVYEPGVVPSSKDDEYGDVEVIKWDLGSIKNIGAVSILLGKEKFGYYLFSILISDDDITYHPVSSALSHRFQETGWQGDPSTHEWITAEEDDLYITSGRYFKLVFHSFPYTGENRNPYCVHEFTVHPPITVIGEAVIQNTHAGEPFYHPNLVSKLQGYIPLLTFVAEDKTRQTEDELKLLADAFLNERIRLFQSVWITSGFDFRAKLYDTVQFTDNFNQLIDFLGMVTARKIIMGNGKYEVALRITDFTGTVLS